LRDSAARRRGSVAAGSAGATIQGLAYGYPHPGFLDGMDGALFEAFRQQLSSLGYIRVIEKQIRRQVEAPASVLAGMISPRSACQRLLDPPAENILLEYLAQEHLHHVGDHRDE
jgi:hypothetical protein